MEGTSNVALWPWYPEGSKVALMLFSKRKTSKTDECGCEQSTVIFAVIPSTKPSSVRGTISAMAFDIEENRNSHISQCHILFNPCHVQSHDKQVFESTVLLPASSPGRLTHLPRRPLECCSTTHVSAYTTSPTTVAGPSELDKLHSWLIRTPECPRYSPHRIRSGIRLL